MKSRAFWSSILVLALLLGLFWWQRPGMTPSQPAQIVAKKPAGAPAETSLPTPPPSSPSLNASSVIPQVPSSGATALNAASANASGSFRFSAGLPEAESQILPRIQHFLGDSPQMMTEAGVSNLNNLVLSPPLAVYRLQNRNLVIQGAGLELARPAGHEYLVTEGGKEVATAAITTTRAGQANVTPAFGGSNDRITKALNYLSSLPQIHPGDYEAQLLILPTGPPFDSAQHRVILLRSASTGPDLIYPLDAGKMTRNIHAGQLYTVDDFLNALYPQRKKAP